MNKQKTKKYGTEKNPSEKKLSDALKTAANAASRHPHRRKIA